MNKIKTLAAFFAISFFVFACKKANKDIEDTVSLLGVWNLSENYVEQFENDSLAFSATFYPEPEETSIYYFLNDSTLVERIDSAGKTLWDETLSYYRVDNLIINQRIDTFEIKVLTKSDLELFTISNTSIVNGDTIFYTSHLRFIR